MRWGVRIPQDIIGRVLVTLTFAAVVYLVVFTITIRQPRVDLTVLGTGRPVCRDFPSQPAAQVALRQYPGLDADRDGVACDHLAGR